MDTRGMLTDERVELVELLRSLTDEEWEAPSLCAGWRVRDVVGHMLTDAVPLGSYVAIALRSGTVDRTNNALVRKSRSLSTAQLVDKLETMDGWFTKYLPRVALSDTFVHQQDIRRPLGKPRKEIPAERMRAVLDLPDPFAFPFRLMRGLRWEATDLDWAKGSGPVVRGPGEALALAMVGRTGALDDLDGDGVPTLRQRCP
ncbi:maleylpyruvate isomerase family mycothiol-dependent enzyme [Nocardia sp. NPDC050406]|uniref:maleylpyruvate isomerase family mycothiol-dependent enzyme n=1 Tax=Nocardia sp. NPDC050406 TaxID=3364318 RepID=UPI0037A0A0C7